MVSISCCWLATIERAIAVAAGYPPELTSSWAMAIAPR